MRVPHFFWKRRRLARLTVKMNTDFQTLIDFLDRCGPDVTGRGLAAPQSDEAAKLQRFATGGCDEVCEMLRLHPAWLRWLADRVKMARATQVTTAG